AANPRRLARIPSPLDQTAVHPLDLKTFYVTFAASVPTLNRHLSCLNYYPRGQPWKRELRLKIQFQAITREQRCSVYLALSSRSPTRKLPITPINALAESGSHPSSQTSHSCGNGRTEPGQRHVLHRFPQARRSLPGPGSGY